MANIALIKMFRGMYLGVAQLAGELERAGHTPHVFSFKQYKYLPDYELEGNTVADYASFIWRISENRELERWTWHAYAPIRPKEFNLLVEELKAFNPSAIAFTMQSTAISSNRELTQMLREHFDVPMIWGGAGPSIEPELCIEHSDVVCVHEGEEVLVEIADRLDAGKSLNGIPGTLSRLPDGSIEKNPSRPKLDLNSIAIPAWDMEKYTYINLNTAHQEPADFIFDSQYPIMTQRGCPFSCSFCIESKYQELFGKKGSLRRRDPDIVIEELIYAKENHPITNIVFWDDVFTINPRWLDEFLPMYKSEIGLPFWCYTYPTTHTPEILAKLKDAGMRAMAMGIQHGSDRILRDYFHRPTPRKRVLEAIDEIIDLGDVSLDVDMISKLPIETEADLRESLELFMQIPKEILLQGIAETVAYPTFGYTRALESDVEANNIISMNSHQISGDIYKFYFSLLLLTRSSLPMADIETLSNDKYYRNNPNELSKVFKDIDYYHDLAKASRKARVEQTMQ
jgi:hypothetical protein